MAIDLKSLNHNQLGDLIARAKARQEELAREKASKLREKINAMVKAEGLARDEVLGRQGTRGRGRGKSKVAAKYRNPSNPEQTWSGRGKRPRWYHDALAAGKKEKDLLIG